MSLSSLAVPVMAREAAGNPWLTDGAQLA
jgi:hypothetical protein